MSAGPETPAVPSQTEPAPQAPVPSEGEGRPAGHGHGHGHGHGRPEAETIEATLVPAEGRHFLHLFYKIDRGELAAMSPQERARGKAELVEILSPSGDAAPAEFQVFAVPGHKADFGLVISDSDLKKVHDIQLALESGILGPAFEATYSYYSITEISEYVPTPEQYGQILVREGVDPESPTYKTKVATYAQRLEPMNRQRLFPEFPAWPCLCFYPMSKMRQGDQNWYLLPFEERSAMMSQHGRSGMKFAGKISQVITASTGLDEWEWGVTLWAKNPSYLKDIVYTMRFDESSARYALFGDFLFGYILPPAELADRLRL
ncbi:MAG: hydrogen peroxide-dependent heme synthase [Isosphaeraceae bacterium]|nr:hydrogen peroxide-dependent heme synthase [Isosphaeraceae bacterium]